VLGHPAQVRTGAEVVTVGVDDHGHHRRSRLWKNFSMPRMVGSLSALHFAGRASGGTTTSPTTSARSVSGNSVDDRPVRDRRRQQVAADLVVPRRRAPGIQRKVPERGMTGRLRHH
jgi:hypothetical protein